MTGKRRELLFQSAIIDSYKAQGGYARKWATDLAVGVPDLIAAHPVMGGHLIEVKHKPTFGGKNINDPRTPKQILEQKRYRAAGMPCYLAIVSGESKKDAKLWLYDVNHLDSGAVTCYHDSWPWEPRLGFNVTEALRALL